jgi:hypothetical protein
VLTRTALSMTSPASPSPVTGPQWPDDSSRVRPTQKTWTSSVLVAHVLATGADRRVLEIPVIVIAAEGMEAAEVARLGEELLARTVAVITMPAPASGRWSNRAAVCELMSVGELRLLLAAPWAEHAMFLTNQAEAASPLLEPAAVAAL